MEFAVAAFGAVATVAMSKLCMVTRKLSGKPKIDATFLKDELESIRAAIIQLCPSGGDPVKCLRIVWMAQLRRLAYDIEDSIDRFDANMIDHESFATQLGELKQRSLDTTKRIKRFEFAEQGAAEGAVVANDPADFLFGDKSRQDCLVYLYLFPPNHPVRTKPLIRRWLAEGLVQREDLAVNNLQDFINSSCISSIERSNNGNIKRCQPTKDILEYISKRSMSEKFILLCDGVGEQQEEEARRLSVHPSANMQLNLPQDLSRLRTLAVFPAGGASLASYEDVLDFARYDVLRVLDLKECGDLSDDHVQAIFEQVLMKYLSINLGSIDRIEREIGHLNQLETLDLSGSQLQTVTVYKEVLMLPKLKHLFGRFQLSKSDASTSGLQEFLKRKSVLETLTGFVTNNRLGFPQLMILMRRLRKVKIWFKSSASQRNLLDLSIAIMKFTKEGMGEPALNRSLSIEFEEASGEFVNTIKPDAGILASFKLRGKLRIFPQFVARLCYIEELCLCLTGLSWGVIIAGLSSVGGLKYLKLIEDKLGRIDPLSVDHLKAIERIYIVCKQRLDVTLRASELPKLVSLRILSQDLRDIPGTPLIDMEGMKNLKEVALHHQVNEAIRTGLLEAAKGHTNSPEVLFLEYPQ